MVVSYLQRGARGIALAAALGAVVSPAAFAQTAIPGLFNTGVNAAGTGLQALGATDVHYSIIAGPGITTPVSPFVLSNQLVGTYAQSPNSEWIWVNANGSGGINSPYTFRITFDLTGLNPATASLSGQYAVDNNASISLNGGTAQFALTGSAPSNFGTFHAFSFTSGFVSGVNTLDFLATDTGNPGGLNVTSLTGTAAAATSGAAPEPGSLALIAGGLLPLGGVVLRKRRTRA